MARRSTSTRKEKGNRFEEEIADLYCAMGYMVQRHVPVCGQEVDILATRHIPGAKPYVVIVECKFKGGRAPAGNQDVQSIAGAFHVACSTGLVSACTVVTTNGFSLEAQRAASAAKIHLATRHNLFAELIDFRAYLRKLKRRYEEDFGAGHESWYIDPSATHHDEKAESLDGFVDHWLTKRNRAPLALLGGYGTGKTSFCMHYSARLMASADALIPVVIQLREFRKALKIESVIRDFLDEECAATAVRFETFWRMYQEGLMLLLFDGFDEMAIRVDSSVVEANLAEIERFACIGGNVILTCRPEFFATQAEEEGAWRPETDMLSERTAIYDPLHISLWSPEQVESYVHRRLVAIKPRPRYHPSYYVERIRRLPELSDMSARAVHLDFIMKLLPSMIAERIPITRVNLYQTYINREMTREAVTNKRLKIVSDEDRLALMRAVAAQRFLRSHDDIDFEFSSQVIKRELRVPKSEVESVTRDFLNRSFLRRTGDRYQFAHKSIGEFLFALELHSRILEGDLSFIENNRCSSAVAGMVLELFGGIPKFADMLRSLKVQDAPEMPDLPYAGRVFFAARSLQDIVESMRAAWHYRRRGERNGGTETSRMFMALTHDLANSIFVLSHYEQLLAERAVDGSRKEDYLKHLSEGWHSARSRLHQLTLFDFNRLTGEIALILTRSECDIAALLASASGFLPARSVSIRGTCHSYEGDKEYLLRAFENIILNARHAIGNNGSVKIALTDATGQGAVRVTIANDGPEIPREIIDRIFDFGFTTREGGSGIGLAVAKTMIEMHGGTIDVRSSPEETAFEILLPRTKAEA